MAHLPLMEWSIADLLCSAAKSTTFSHDTCEETQTSHAYSFIKPEERQKERLVQIQLRCIVIQMKWLFN